MSEVKLVTFGAIETLSNRVSNQGENLNQTVQQLTREFQASEDYWKGNAHTEFKAAFDQWNGAWVKMLESLQDMHRVMNQWLERERLNDNVH